MPDNRIKIALSPEALQRVDDLRGLVPRQRWLQALIEDAVSRSAPDTAETVAEKMKPVQAIKKAIDTTTAHGTVAALTPDRDKPRRLEHHPFVGIKERCGRCHGLKEDHAA